VNASVCALVSGGVDSCALLAHLTTRYRRVYPLYIRQGYVWETAELRALRRFLRAARLRHAPLTVLELPVGRLLGRHWSRTGRNAPGARTADAAVYLPGRNLLLLSVAALFCELRRVPVIALGSLNQNPFGDATPQFFRDFGRLTGLRVIAPFRRWDKARVVRRFGHLPLALSFSCLAPRRGRPCGRCNKCAERQRVLPRGLQLNERPIRQ
jgi:7-cyano-7-deazaguanine synthase